MKNRWRPRPRAYASPVKKRVTDLKWVHVGDGIYRAASSKPGGTFAYEIAPIGEVSWVLTAHPALNLEPYTHWSRAACKDRARNHELSLMEHRS